VQQKQAAHRSRILSVPGKLGVLVTAKVMELLSR